MAIYIGVVENGQIRLEGDQALPEGARVRVVILDDDEDDEDGLEEFRGITGEEILKSGMVGIWADRDDIGDTVEFVEKLRRRAERRE
jgi:hypothetical protein